jgi:hypothetical protein
MLEKREKLTEQLPPTPCTPEMRQQVVDIAQKYGLSIAKVQREAISIFLSNYLSKATVETSLAHGENAQIVIQEAIPSS